MFRFASPMTRREFLGLVLAALAVPAPAGASEAELEALAAEYKALRERKRGIPQGTFDAVTSASGGRLVEVMHELGKRLGKPGTKAERVLELMGPPDASKTGLRMRPYLPNNYHEETKLLRELADRRGARFLIYFWRGWHDILYFCVVGKTVRAHGWWAALD